jgi:hypothetical protein
MPGSNSISTRFDTEKIEVVRGVVRSSKFPLVPFVFELRHSFNLPFHTLASRFYSSAAR